MDVTRRVHAKTARRLGATTGSALIHLIMLALLMPRDPHGLPGAPGAEQGAGINVTLVRAATLGLAAPNPPPMNAMATEPPPAPEMQAAAQTDSSLNDQGAVFAPEDRPAQPRSETAPRAVAWASRGESNVAATREGTHRGAAEAAGGDPSTTEDLLIQIARCLPAQLRPRLLAQRLVLKLDAGGALVAAPAIQSTLPMMTAEDRADADRVVQAALQCGPYRQQTATSRVVTLAVDFSAIRPMQERIQQ